MTAPAYERDPYLTKLDTEVTDCGFDPTGRPWAIAADTLLYPEGGGQPSDRGTLAGAAVLDVQRNHRRIVHTLAAPVGCGPATMTLDWTRRFDHMQQHTAQHLLTATAHGRFGWATTAFHLGPELSDVELDAPRLGPDELAALEDAVAAEVRAARPVTARWVTAEAYAELPVRSRGLPEGHAGDIRLVEIVGVDLNTCGGTHVRSTAELGMVSLVSTERLRGGTRVFFVAGDRARQRMAAHEARNLRLRELLGAPDAELVALTELRESQLRDARRAITRLAGELARAEAAALAARPGAVLDGHWPDGDAAFLVELGRRLAEHAPDRAALLTAGEDPNGVFVVVAGPSSGLDLAALGARVAEVLGGRGGGRPPLYQGKATRLAARAAALAILAGDRSDEPQRHKDTEVD